MPVAQCVHDVERTTLALQLGADEQADPAHLDELAHVRQRRLQVLAHQLRRLDELLVTQHVEGGLSGGDRHRTAAERVEVARVPVELVDQVVAGHHGGDRLSVAHGLSDCHHVGHDAVAVETPHALTQSTETGLHLVGDEQAPCRANRSHRSAEVGDIREHAVRGEDRVRDQGGRPDARSRELREGRGHLAAEVRRVDQPHPAGNGLDAAE